MATASSSSPLIRCTAVSWSSAWLSRRVSPTRRASSIGAFRQVGVRRVELVCRGGDGEHGRLDVDIPGRQGAGLPQQGLLLAWLRQLGHDARCVRDELGRARQLEGSATRIAGPAGRLGRGSVEPDGLVARVPAPGHGRAEAERLGGFGGVSRKRCRLLVPFLSFAQPSPRIGEPCQAYGELVGLGPQHGLAGRPAKPGAQIVGHLVEPAT